MRAQFKAGSDCIDVVLSLAIKTDVDYACVIPVSISRPLPDHQGTALL